MVILVTGVLILVTGVVILASGVVLLVTLMWSYFIRVTA